MIPGTDTPVAINTVNDGNPEGNTTATNPAYYRNNDVASGAPINTELDGLTVVLTLTANVNAGVKNHIKLAIADASDCIYDSDVFIRAGSFVAAPSVAFSSANYSVGEGDRNATIDVNLSAASTQTVTVHYATSDGTANAPGDYTATSGTLTFAPGDTSKSFKVPIVDDALVEGPETVNLTLSNPGNATLGSPSAAVLTIIDNDMPKYISGIVRIEPETLNLDSKGVFTAFIRLPEGFNVADIDLAMVKCEGAPATKGVVAGSTLVVKFDRQSLVGVSVGDEVTFTVTGKLVDGTPFSGSDTIRVMDIW